MAKALGAVTYPGLDATLALALRHALDAPECFRRSVATDADGTLWDHDVGDAFFLSLCERGQLSDEGAALVRRFAAKHLGSDRESDALPSIAKSLIAKYTAGEIAVRDICDLEAAAVAGRPWAALKELCREYAAEFVRNVRPGVRALLNAAKSEGLRVHVVSGSLEVLVAEVCARGEIPFDAVSGARVRRENDQCFVAIDGEVPLFEGKIAALRATGDGPAALAQGDGRWDAPFLSEAHCALLVQPSKGLDEATASLPLRLRYDGR